MKIKLYYLMKKSASYQDFFLGIFKKNEIVQEMNRFLTYGETIGAGPVPPGIFIFVNAETDKVVGLSTNSPDEIFLGDIDRRFRDAEDFWPPRLTESV